MTWLYFPMRWRILFMQRSLVPVQILGYSPIPVWWKLGVQLQRWRISSYAASNRQLDISYLKNGAQLTKGLPLTRLVPMAQKRLMKWKLIGTRKGFLKAQRKPHPWLTCCVSIFEIFLKRTCRISWASISGSVHLQSNSPGLWDWIYLWLRLWWWLVSWWRPLGILSRQKCQFLWYS